MAFTPFNPFPIQLQDASGNNYSSSELRFFLAGTSTATNMYSNNTGTSIGNTISLNANGYPESGGNVITLFRDTSVNLKVEFHANASSVTAIWTADGLKDALVLLGSTTNGEGASLVSVEDSAGNFTASGLEAVLAEIASNFLQDLVDDTTPQLGGTLACDDNIVERPVLKDIGYTHNTVAISSGAVIFDCSTGNSFDVSLTENITSITLSNPPATGTKGIIEITFVQDGTGSRTVAGWPASVEWTSGSAPTITTTATTGTDDITLRTHDGGTSWRGNYSQDYS